MPSDLRFTQAERPNFGREQFAQCGLGHRMDTATNAVSNNNRCHGRVRVLHPLDVLDDAPRTGPAGKASSH